jgi:PAS domain S-box-containing protein
MTESHIVSATIDRTRHTVLVVDDNPATRYSTARVLRAAGFRTVEAASGNDALHMAQGNISAVVLDVNLPDIDGLQVCQRLRADPHTTGLPVIHLSATYVEDRHKVQGLDSGADAYITHPAEPPVLVATIQALVRARMAEEQLRRSEMKFRAIYTQAESGIVVLDAAGTVTDVNPAMLRMLGRSATDVIGHPLASFAPAEWQDRVRHRSSGTERVEPVWHEHMPMQHADGTLVHLEWSLSAYLEPQLRVAVANNVTERVLLEQSRQKLLEREQAARRVAERHSQTKDDFIAVLSHELRNPLNAMMMALHVLETRSVQPELAKSIAVIDRNARTQARLISDILDVARINSGKLTLNREMVRPGLLVTASLQGMQAQIDQKRLHIALQLDPDDGPMWLDPARFQQVVWNILTNAIKFSHADGSIQIVLEHAGGMLELVVTDQGIGIEPEFLGTVFDKFAQGAAPTSSRGGLGLGLSIVLHVVELHGGTVAVHSAGSNKGTTVRIRLPMQTPSDTAAPPAGHHALTEPATRHDLALDGLRVLVVEDEPQAREMLSLILRDHGATVAEAQDYDSAIQCWSAGPADVVVADIGMPGKDGYTLLRDLRDLASKHGTLPRPKRFIAVALTAFGRQEDLDQAAAASFDLHMPKPLRPLQLIAAVARLSRTRG